MKKDYDTFHKGYQAHKKSILMFIKLLEDGRKKYKSFDDKWELNYLKSLIRQT